MVGSKPGGRCLVSKEVELQEFKGIGIDQRIGQLWIKEIGSAAIVANQIEKSEEIAHI